MSILSSFFILLGFLIFLITLPGTLELLFVTLGALLNYFFPMKKLKTPSFSKQKIIALIPAHNEEKSIAHTIKALRFSGFYEDVWVIADNCMDKTAEIAKQENAKVIERIDPLHRGKHYALQFAFEKLKSEDYDIYFIVDADTFSTQVSKEDLEQLFQAGADAVQVLNTLYSTKQTPKSRFLSLAFQAFNHVRPLGREYWKLSIGILGNGFALSRDTLSKASFDVGSLVEDLEYHLKLVKAGLKVHFLETSNVQSEISSQDAGASQRSRWEGGRLRLLLDAGPSLLKDILKGHYRLIEPLLDLCLLPLSYHVLLLFFLLFIPNSFIFDYAVFGFLVLLLHGIATLLVAHATWKDVLSVFAAPFHILWKVKIFSKVLEGAQKTFGWSRTDRT